MSVKFKIDGFKDLEKALAQLPAGTAKGATRRSMKKILKPIAYAAEASPFTIGITSGLIPSQRRDARGDFRPGVVAMFVGPVDDDGKGAPHAHLLEFGTQPRFHKNGRFVGAVMADPFMRPAWDAHKDSLLEQLGAEVWDQITKALERAARKAAKQAGG